MAATNDTSYIQCSVCARGNNQVKDSRELPCGDVQAHYGIQGPNNEMITMKEYQQSSDKHSNMPCEHHAEEVSIKAIAKGASELACKRCDKTTDCRDFEYEFKLLSEVVKKEEELIKLSNTRRPEHLNTERGLYVFDNNSRKLTKCRLPYKRVYAAAEHRHAVYVLHGMGDTNEIDICVPNIEVTQTLFEFENPTDRVPYTSVCNRRIFVFNTEGSAGAGQVIIYDMVCRQKHILPIASVHCPYFLSSSELLAADDHQLVKHCIDRGKLTAIRTEKLSKILQVCADSNGVISACTGNEQQSVYFISLAGELREIRNDKLLAESGEFSARENELVVSGWVDGKLSVFKANY